MLHFQRGNSILSFFMYVVHFENIHFAIKFEQRIQLYRYIYVFGLYIESNSIILQKNFKFKTLLFVYRVRNGHKAAQLLSMPHVI